MKTEEQIIKRYERMVRECNKDYDKHKDTDKLKLMSKVQRNELAWVLDK
jgi:hypothetical protein